VLGRTHAWWRGWRERQRQYKIERALFKAANGGMPMGGPVPPQAFGEGLATSTPPKPPPASER
jgi:hypothetical protein